MEKLRGSKLIERDSERGERPASLVSLFFFFYFLYHCFYVGDCLLTLPLSTEIVDFTRKKKRKKKIAKHFTDYKNDELSVSIVLLDICGIGGSKKLEV